MTDRDSPRVVMRTGAAHKCEVCGLPVSESDRAVVTIGDAAASMLVCGECLEGPRELIDRFRAERLRERIENPRVVGFVCGRSGCHAMFDLPPKPKRATKKRKSRGE